MQHNISLRKFLTVVFLSFVLTGCSNASPKNGKDFGPDENYFLGLKSLSKGDEKDARQKFNKAVKKGTPLVALRSSEALCSFGDVQEKIKAAKNLLQFSQEESSLVTACKIFLENKEYGQVLSFTNTINIQESSDALVSIRLRAMEKRNITGLQENIQTWFLEKPLSQSHFDFYNDYSETKYFDVEKSFENFLITFRLDVYKRNFSGAFEKLSEIESRLETDESFLNVQLISDIGKTHLYGNTNNGETGGALKSASWFSTQVGNFQGTPLEFFFWFYAGRLYEKSGGYQKRAISCFEKAADCTNLPSQKDNARWYVLRTSLKGEIENCLQYVKQNLEFFEDPSYYDDFFDLLSPILLNNHYYKEIGELYKLMKGHASREATAKYAYIYARLLQEEIYKPGENLLQGKTVADEIDEALHIALDSSTDLYYKVVAAQALNLSESEKKRIYTEPRKSVEVKVNPDAERLLNGYAAYGFPEKIYDEWLKLGQCFLSEETTLTLCRLLQKCSDGRDDFYPQSLRIASRHANYSPVIFSEDLLRFCFPKCYEELITENAEKNGIEPAVLFALIRSESFFDSDVYSSAGAIGLCQLMTFTAEDIARRLKKSNYDLLDPETNIEFGAWYLGNLISRLDGNYLNAFYSYNAGITRVRKWKQSFSFGFGIKNVPEDLFLETLPYAETREYGRKLVSATEMYQRLY